MTGYGLDSVTELRHVSTRVAASMMNRLIALLIIQRVSVLEVLRLAAINGAAIALGFLAIHLLRPRLAKRKIQSHGYSGPVLRHEGLFSLLTLLIGGNIGVGTVSLVQHGVIRIAYGDPGLGAVLAQFVAYLFAFDAYYYLIHRALHTRMLYWWVHSVHHRSVTPNPLTAFSVHPVEALLTGIFLPFALTLHAFYLHAVLLVSIHATLNPILLHSGYEIFPRSWYRWWFGSWYVTPSFHDAHHSESAGNYGVYTTIWDQLFGTIAPQFASAHGWPLKTSVNALAA